MDRLTWHNGDHVRIYVDLRVREPSSQQAGIVRWIHDERAIQQSAASVRASTYAPGDLSLTVQSRLTGNGERMTRMAPANGTEFVDSLMDHNAKVAGEIGSAIRAAASKPRKQRWAALVALLGTAIAVTCTAQSERFPRKPVRIVTSVTGGSQDLTARVIAPLLAESLGQPVIVDNRGAYLSMELVAKAPPDGYTLLMASASLWLVQFLMSEVLWNVEKDFAPITLAVNSPDVVVVHPSLPVKSLQELIAWAKARPGELNYSTGQAGSSSHIAGEMFKWMTGTKIQRIAFKGGGPAMFSLLAGEVQVMFPNAATALPYVKSGRIRPLAVTSARPSALFPGLVTANDAGLPGFEAGAILAIFAPAKTPQTIITRLNQEIVRILNRADVKQRLLDSSGAEVVAGSPAELAAAIKADVAITGKLIKEVGILSD
jgi:tripartite-type tricarboxylate transporter receptor subunit TctC